MNNDEFDHLVKANDRPLSSTV